MSSFPGTMTVTINPSSNSVLVYDGSLSADFAATDRVTASGYEHRFEKTGSQTFDRVQLFGNAISPAPSAAVPSDSSATLTLRYTSFARWTHIDRVTGITTVSYAIFGMPTDPADVPTIGAFGYYARTESEDYHFGSGTIAKYPVSGKVSFSADFAALQVNPTASRGSTEPGFTGQGSLLAGRFVGQLTTGPTRTGVVYLRAANFSGSFFGPKAAEVSYVYLIREAGMDPFAGASIGSSDKWLSGVVAGIKYVPAP